MNRRQQGARYEAMAAAYLKTRGYDILERNFRCRKGEIDIVARKDNCIIFTEVKYRNSPDSGYPSEAVSLSKQKAICETYLYYLKTKGYGAGGNVRYDVIEFMGDKMRHIQDAFDFPYSYSV